MKGHLFHFTFQPYETLLLQVGVGFLAQYLIKPLLGFVIAMVLLSPSHSEVPTLACFDL